MSTKGPTIPDTFPRREAYRRMHNGLAVIGFPGYEVVEVHTDNDGGTEYRLICTPGQHDVNEHFVPTPETIAREVMEDAGFTQAYDIRNGTQVYALLVAAVRKARG